MLRPFDFISNHPGHAATPYCNIPLLHLLSNFKHFGQQLFDQTKFFNVAEGAAVNTIIIHAAA